MACVDKNECSGGPNPCGSVGTCTNANPPAFYTCTCPPRLPWIDVRMPRSIESRMEDPTTTIIEPTSTMAPRIAVRTGAAVRFRKAIILFRSANQKSNDLGGT